MLASILDEFDQKETVENPPEEKPESKFVNSRPCEICQSAIFWIDTYGGGPHCSVCSPWPIPAMVKLRLAVVCVPGGGFAYERMERSKSMGEPARNDHRPPEPEPDPTAPGWFGRWWNNLTDPSVLDEAEHARQWNAAARDHGAAERAKAIARSDARHKAMAERRLAKQN